MILQLSLDSNYWRQDLYNTNFYSNKDYSDTGILTLSIAWVRLNRFRFQGENTNTLILISYGGKADIYASHFNAPESCINKSYGSIFIDPLTYFDLESDTHINVHYASVVCGAVKPLPRISCLLMDHQLKLLSCFLMDHQLKLRCRLQKDTKNDSAFQEHG